MKRIITALLLSVLLIPAAKAQLEKVIVEKYYVSNDSDATDQTGGLLKSGSVTYRVYVDMVKGSKLLQVFGDKNYTLKFASDSIFFNNQDRGEVYGYNIAKARYAENTVGVDTWLTLGQATKAINSANGPYAYFGVPKVSDKSGSFVGGKNNDGGSEGLISGLLSNNDPSAGIPLTTSDGLDTLNSLPTIYVQSTSSLEPTIFGSTTPGKQFSSDDLVLQTVSPGNIGVQGVVADNNQVLIGQFTTNGAFSFELNVKISSPDGKRIFAYVAQKNSKIDSLAKDTITSPYMTYPLVCGCTDGNYKEFNAAYGCANPNACKTLLIIGCMDPLSCNYNPKANVNDPTQCCYPGHCNDRDIKLVCPALGDGASLRLSELADIYPNPAQNELTIKYLFDSDNAISYSIYDAFGKLMLTKNEANAKQDMTELLDLSALQNGLYMFRLTSGDKTFSKKFLKN